MNVTDTHIQSFFKFNLTREKRRILKRFAKFMLSNPKKVGSLTTYQVFSSNTGLCHNFERWVLANHIDCRCDLLYTGFLNSCPFYDYDTHYTWNPSNPFRYNKYEDVPENTRLKFLRDCLKLSTN